MDNQPDPASLFLAYGSVALLLLLCLSVTIGKLGEWMKRRRVMSRELPWSDDETAPDPPATTTPRNDGNGTAISTTEYNALLFAAKADALAAMVHAGKVGETEGIKIVFGVGPSSTNKTYQTAREMLKARLARLAPDKFKLSTEQKALRDELGLSNGRNP
jgi:hypothetical protein